jgi:eukaryotic-like serine/threonine-protein kinase
MDDSMPTSFPERLLATRLLDQEKLDAARAAVGDQEGTLARYLVREGLLTRFQVRQIRAGATSFHVDKYVVVDCLGRGGNSIVYKARNILLPNRFVALKTLDTGNLHRANDALARFRREIDIVARLEHPNVVRAYDVIRTRSQIYLVLEYIEGRDLGNLIKERGPLPIAEAVGYAVQAAQGLSYAHKCGIVHRDLKPGNLLLTRDGTVKLSDLGLARFYVHGEDDGLTLKGAFLGTPEFMAPEQAEDSSRADARSDLFSLGATLFHLLTGKLPIDGSTMIHRLQQLLMVPQRPLADSRPDVPADLAALVDRLRDRDPERRPQTADEVILALRPHRRLNSVPEADRWDAGSKAKLVIEVLQGKIGPVQACEQNEIAPEEFDRWRQTFLEGGRRSLDPAAAAKDEADKIRDLHAKIGLQSMEIEDLKKQLAAHLGKNGALKVAQPKL